MADTVYDLSGCACCEIVSTPCNPTPVSKELTLTVTYNCVQFSREIQYHPTVIAGGPGWTYGLSDTYSGPVDMCGVLDFNDFSLWCVGGNWNAAWSYLQDGIQQSDDTVTGSMTDVLIHSTDPLCVTTTSPDADFSDCGFGTIRFTIGECDAIPMCCNDSGLPATATLSYSITGVPANTLTLNKNNNTPSYSGIQNCDVGDGHTVVRIAAAIACNCAAGTWSLSFSFVKLVDAAQTGNIVWLEIPAIGRVYANISGSCSPFHFHWESVHFSSSGSAQVCGGVTYPIGAVASVLGIFDVVVP